LLLPKTNPMILSYYSTLSIFPAIYDAFLVRAPFTDLPYPREPSEQPSPIPWLQEYDLSGLEKCTSRKTDKEELEIKSCPPDASLVKVGKERHRAATTVRSLLFAVGYNQSVEFHSIFENTNANFPLDHFNWTNGPSSFRTNQKLWRGIPVHSSPQIEPKSSLAHWDSEFSTLGDSPEALFGSSVDFLSANHSPWFSKNGTTLDKTYLKSGYGSCVIAALHTMGYAIKGLPFEPMEGTVMKFQVRSNWMNIGLISIIVIAALSLFLIAAVVIKLRRIYSSKTI
jgi:hypothetical protein